ncbi:MAG: DUF6145 family protein [Eubacteriales bacterium]|nr:DUF6145 family protein [Eubacteriales bacterium]
MNNSSENVVLCGASKYDRKYYFNDQFAILPQRIKDELQIICVKFTEEIGGVFSIEYEEDGSLQLRTEAVSADAMYDEIGAGLLIKQLQEEKTELFQSLELFYKVFADGGMV